MTEYSVDRLRTAAGNDYIPAEVRKMLTAYADLVAVGERGERFYRSTT